VGAFQPVADFTDALAAEKRVTASCLKPMMEHLNKEALVVNERDSSLKTDMQSKIKQYMNTKCDDINIKDFKIVARRMEESFAPGEIMLTKATQAETVQTPFNKTKKIV